MPVEKDRIDTSGTVVFGTVATVWVIIAVIVLQGFFYQAEDEMIAERIESAPATEGEVVKSEQQSKLVEDPTWANKEKTRVMIPIEDAMRAVVTEMGDKNDK